jgi:hypothetical protein
VEDAARQLIGLNAGLQGLYLAIFAFSDLRQQVEAIHLFLPGGFILLLFFLPILLWLISLYCATRVFVPQVRPGANLNEVSASAWRDIRKTYRQTVDTKLSWLHRSHRWLVGSFAVVLVLLVCLAFLPPAPAPGPTQIIIITPTPVVAPTAKP